MKINNVSFPHPVLNISDDISGTFDAIPSVVYGKDTTKIIINWKLDCKSLSELIAKKLAIFCLEVNCPDTLYRNIFTSYLDSQEISINTNELRNSVRLDFYIIANEDIDLYSMSEFNIDYRGYSFSVQKGDALAIVGKKANFPAEKSWEALKAVSSFMDIGSYPEKTGPVLYNFSGQKIKILLSEDDFLNYGKVMKTDYLPPVFQSALVLPALVKALVHVINTPDGDEKKWFQVLKIRLESDEFKEKIKNKNIDLENLMEIAQALLDNPIHRTLLGIEQFTHREDKNDDY